MTPSSSRDAGQFACCTQIGGCLGDAFAWLLLGWHFKLVDANSLLLSSPTMSHSQTSQWTRGPWAWARAAIPFLEERVLWFRILPLVKEGETLTWQRYFAKLLFCLRSSRQVLNGALVSICKKHVRQRSVTSGSAMVLRGSVNIRKPCLKFLDVYFSVLKVRRVYHFKGILAPIKI